MNFANICIGYKGWREKNRRALENQVRAMAQSGGLEGHRASRRLAQGICTEVCLGRVPKPPVGLVTGR